MSNNLGGYFCLVISIICLVILIIYPSYLEKLNHADSVFSDKYIIVTIFLGLSVLFLPLISLILSIILFLNKDYGKTIRWLNLIISIFNFLLDILVLLGALSHSFFS